MKTTTHSLLFAIVASATLPLVLASRLEPIEEREAIQIRALVAPVSNSPTSPGTTAAASTSTPAGTSAASTSSAAATTTSPAAATSATTSSASAAGTTTTHAGSTSASSSQAVPKSSVIPTTATDSLGQIFTSYITDTAPPSSSATPSATNASSDSGGGGLSTGSIIGLSVAGGIAAIGIILFFLWKFTRKRFSDFDDNEAIKWPELNAHNDGVHALPTHSTGMAGFGPENDSNVNLTRPPSPGAYANSIAASSVPEVYSAEDPYVVPPLPHLNPNQPYRDEPGVYGQPAGYYDPYRESIPMTQMARARSPGPQMAYDMQGRSSPAPQAVMGYAGMDERSRTPNPSMLVAGRASPGPNPGYGYGPR